MDDFSKEFTKTLLDLAACRLSPEKWTAWWESYSQEVSQLVDPNTYLRLKPRKWDGNEGPWRAPYVSQEGAIAYLQKNNIDFEYSDKYKLNYEKHFEEFCRAQDAKRKAVMEKLQAKHPRLAEAYPKFFRSLKNNFDLSDRIEAGVTEDEITAEPIPLPGDIKDFFRIVSVISLEGISIDFRDLRHETLCGKEYVCLGEFWRLADGDLLLIKPDGTELPTKIYYYSHGENKVTKLCNSIGDLMEKKFSYYNNQ
jgi:hypothetical protein